MSRQTARDEIVARLYAQARPAEHPAPWQSRRAYDDLAAAFAESVAAAGGEMHRAPSLAAGLDKLGELWAAMGAARVVVNPEPPLDTLDLPGRWPAIDWHIVGESEREREHEGDTRAFSASADAGLGGALAALAETGTIVVGSGPEQSRLATLLPPVHVALVSEACIVPDIFTWAAARAETMPALPSSLNFISGPSKTADIEQTLAVGVHGPKRFVVVLYGG